MEKNGIEWATGLFEGEGCISFRRMRNRKDSYKISVSLASTDKDVVDKFCSIVNKGRVKGPYKGTNKPNYIWEVQNYSDCLNVLGQLYPYLGNRRKQKADEFIEIAIDRWII